MRRTGMWLRVLRLCQAFASRTFMGVVLFLGICLDHQAGGAPEPPPSYHRALEKEDRIRGQECMGERTKHSCTPSPGSHESCNTPRGTFPPGCCFQAPSSSPDQLYKSRSLAPPGEAYAASQPPALVHTHCVCVTKGFRQLVSGGIGQCL